MASLSLPRVLQLKKNSLDAEREQFEKFQTLAIQKAINAIETPVKEKHVRSTIIGTFQEQSAVTYWMVAIRLPIQENRIVAWKFCHVTHKLLREGHPACLDDSQRHISMIENLGKLWVHLREGYGKLVHLYCNLLVCKLKFHSRNPRFPGNMQLTADELDAIAENDVNNYFQLCVELFDYMEEILNLQASVFDSLGNARANSMTASGQCRLAALIPCAQDASQIYDCNVRLLFRLHASLPPDTLAGHRERFRQQFKKLSSFYKHASSLQYYRNLLTLPVLPSNPPNFLIQSDFGTYVTPVVSIPEPSPDEVDAVGALIDTSDIMSQTTSDHSEDLEARPTPSPQPDPIVERDRLNDHLQQELKRMRSEVSQLLQERNVMLNSMKEHCTRLESQLHTTKAELEQERQKAEILSVEAPEIKRKLTETEEKAKVQDEKFQKLKGAYTQLREEHITLIRQKAEVDKLSANLRASVAQHESAKLALQQQLNDRMKDVELLQQSASSSEEIEAYKSELSSVRNDLEQARQKELELETLRGSMEALEIDYKTAAKEQEDKLSTITNELKETTEMLDIIKREKEERELELAKVKEELVGLREKSGDEYKKVIEEKEAALSQVAELKQQHLQEKEELSRLNNQIQELQSDIVTLQDKITVLKSDHVAECQNLNQEFTKKKEDVEQLLSDTENKLHSALDKIENLQQELEEKVMEISTLNSELVQKQKIEKKNEEYLNEISQLTANLKDLEQKSIDDTFNIKQNLMPKIDEQMQKIDSLKKLLAEQELISKTHKSEINSLTENVALLTSTIEKKTNEITELYEQLNENSSNHTSKLEATKIEYEKSLRELTLVHENLKDNLESMIKNTEDKEETIRSLEDLLKNKETDILSRDAKLGRLSDEISGLKDELKDTMAELEIANSELKAHKIDYEKSLRELTLVHENLKDKLESMIKDKEDKEETIRSLEVLLKNKETDILSRDAELGRLSDEIFGLKDELKETMAELEIANSELIDLKEVHDKSMEENENNLSSKNLEIVKLNYEKVELETQIKTQRANMDEINSQKQVLENDISELKKAFESFKTNQQSSKLQNESIIDALNNELDNIRMSYNNLKEDKESEIKLLNDKNINLQSFCDEEIQTKNNTIYEAEEKLQIMRKELEELKELVLKERVDMNIVVSTKDHEIQLLENRLEHVESKRLNAECELQDLLQHNTVLETDLAAIKKQLQDTQKTLEKQTSLLVSCAGDAALQVTNEAIAAFEHANTHDSINTAAEQAAKALEQLAMNSNVLGNEESVAKSTIFAAHNAAQLSTYVTDVSNISTDMELSEKLNNECRSMLTGVQECLKSIKSGSVISASCIQAKSLVRAMMTSAAAASRKNTGARSVDDELADMDRAIEEAASQIESMLAATRAGGSGVKLEVNGKILDACTTLMGAVKILVQDARKLQNELGDPKTRQKMYRKNPQWSEGLISAAKAVVFAAKLLVTSADEAVGAAGQVEGVSAAAHEVAGSTAQLVAASRARAPPESPALARLTHASRSVAAATGALVAAVKAASALVLEQDALDTSSLSLTATRRLEMESKVRSLKLETALDAERARLAALRKRHYQLAQLEENGNLENGKD